MPTNIHTASAASPPTLKQGLQIRRPAFWVVFPLLLGLLSLGLSLQAPAFRNLGAFQQGAELNFGP